MLKDAARRGFLFALLAGLVLASLGAAPPTGQEAIGPHAPDRILVKFKPGTDTATEARVHRQNGGVVVKSIPQLGVEVVGVAGGTVPAKVAAYAGSTAVEYAEPDAIARAVETIVNDPNYKEQWGLAKIQASYAWDYTKGDGVKIAILDTGIDRNHPDLTGKVDSNQKNFTDSPTSDDVDGHGTHVAGIAAAATNNNIGVAGTGYNAVVMNGKVLGDDGSGAYSWIADGIVWAADNGAKVINMSLGGSFNSKTLGNAVKYAWQKGVVVVAAAGNNGSAAKFYPAAYPNAIAVAATDSNDAKASFSSFGSKWVDIAAPGVGILSTTNDGKYASWSGTSMATPFVSGTAALLWATKYGTSNSSVRSRIESTADKIAGTGKYWSAGRVNAYNAVK